MLGSKISSAVERMTDHKFLTKAQDADGDHYSIGYPDECRDFALFSDSLAPLITDGAWSIQPFTQKQTATIIDFKSERETEAEASLRQSACDKAHL
jgi:hypothetical protein